MYPTNPLQPTLSSSPASYRG